MAKVGFELPNTAEVDETAWERIETLGCEVLKGRTYHRDAVLARAAGIAPEFLLRLAADHPVRLSEDADELSGAIERCQAAGLHVTVELTNEPNLMPHYREAGPEALLEDMRCLVAALRERWPDVPLIGPPLAVEPGEASPGSHLRFARVLLAPDALPVDGHALHHYWEGEAGRRSLAFWDHPWTLASLVPDRPVWITEVGDSSKDGWARKAPRLLEAMLRVDGDPRFAAFIIFIAVGTVEWERFVPPLEVCRWLRTELDAERRSRRSVGGSRTAPTATTERRMADHRVAFEAAGAFGSREGARPRLIVIHATRSGDAGNSPEQELQGTLRWFLDSRGRPDQRTWASAHDVIAADGTRHACLDPERMAWHAGYLNPFSIGIEVAQPTREAPFPEAQVAATAARVRQLCVEYGIPMVRVMSEAESGVIGHEDTAQGRALGKSDPGDAARGGRWDWGAFMALVGEEAGTEGVPGLPNTSEVQAYLDAAWGKTLETERTATALMRLQGEVRDYLILIKRELELRDRLH